MKRIVETVFGFVSLGAGVWIGISSAPVISTQVLILVLALVGVGGFFISKSLMKEAVLSAKEIMRAKR